MAIIGNIGVILIMGIYMYNVKFGDCFQLADDLYPDGLVVDFGSLSALGSQFDKIVDHFDSTKPKKILISHYHLDHLSGLLYMMTNGLVYKFSEILIPDIFSTRGLQRAIVLLYLNDFLESCNMPRRGRGTKYTLLEFATYLCANPLKVRLLKRSDKFDACTVLWPDEKHIVKYADELLLLFDNSSAFVKELTDISDITAHLITTLIESGTNTISERHQETLLTIRTRLDNLSRHHDLQYQLLRYQTQLTSFGHTVNVVFHNSVNGDNNFLFTGDIEKKDMKIIEVNTDKNPELDLHMEYKYIKIPHHGTSAHFYDYTRYLPKNILISNGKSRVLNSYMIASDYSKLYSTTTKLYCSNCNFCEAWATSCRCTNRQIIWPDTQKYIL